MDSLCSDTHCSAYKRSLNLPVDTIFINIRLVFLNIISLIDNVAIFVYFTDDITSWLIVMEYLLQRWRRICSNCRHHTPTSFPCMWLPNKNHRVCLHDHHVGYPMLSFICLFSQWRCKLIFTKWVCIFRWQLWNIRFTNEIRNYDAGLFSRKRPSEKDLLSGV